MITLYGFGPPMGLPEISPFVTKAHILLQMAGLPYETSADPAGFLKAPNEQAAEVEPAFECANRERGNLIWRNASRPRSDG